MLVQDAFFRAAARLPDKVAIVADEERCTYRELEQRVCALAAALRDDGIGPGDRVVVQLEPGVDYAVAVHAVLAAGAVFVPLSPTAKSDKLSFVLSDTGARGLLTQQQLQRTWAPVLDGAESFVSCRVAGAMQPDARVKPWPGLDSSSARIETPRIDQDLAALIYTSGSTGVPKGVMLTHLNMVSAWASVQAYLGLREDDVIGLALAPVFSYGLYNLLMGLGVGATVVIERAAAFPVRVAETLARECVTVFPGVPTLFVALLGLQHLKRFDLSAIRLLTNAAAALPTHHVRRLTEAFPAAQFFSMYGMTECMRISYLPPDEVRERPGSVGRGMSNQAHWLIGEGGERLPNGSTGELVVRGSHVTRGYWRRPDETAVRLKSVDVSGDRVLHTGDLFRTDADGYLYFVSRMDDIIMTRGEKVAPREVEGAIYELDGVVDCAVIGVPDELLGEAVKAFVTLRPDSTTTPRDIIRHCLARLENHMAPKSVEIVDALPRTDSGKIRHASLR